MKILVTGAAGFIGYHVTRGLLEQGHAVIGIDNLNPYYDVRLKYARLKETGIEKSEIMPGVSSRSNLFTSDQFIWMDVNDGEALNALFERESFTHVIHLAAQAGVRYSIRNPFAYIDANIAGFLHLLEACRYHPVQHLVYASSSSVYGNNAINPSKEDDVTDRPVSLYAATKKANELMAHAHASLYHIPATGVRFFTVYGPWGRPDMAPSLFISAVLRGDPIPLFNHGHMTRDFTYIDDVVEGLLKIIPSPPRKDIPHDIYNIGSSSPVELTRFIEVIENVTGIKAVIQWKPMQPGDAVSTFADTSHLRRDFYFQPTTSIQTGIEKFFQWFIEFYQPTFSL